MIFFLKIYYEASITVKCFKATVKCFKAISREVKNKANSILLILQPDIQRFSFYEDCFWEEERTPFSLTDYAKKPTF